MKPSPDREERILVLLPEPAELDLARTLIDESGAIFQECAEVEELCDGLEQGAALALVAQEALTGPPTARLAGLQQDERGAALLIVLFGGDGDAGVSTRFLDILEPLGNVVALARPVQPLTLAATIRSALSTRQRLDELHDRLSRLQDELMARDELLARLTHRLRTPLNTILTAVEILEQVGSRNSLAVEQRALIGRQTRAMAGLLDNVDGIFRDGGVATRREPIDLAELVQQALTRGRAPLRPQQQLSFAAVDRPLVVNGDRARLHQVILNLLADAAERTPDGGQIEVSVYRDGNEAVLRLHDDGTGLDAERLRQFSTDPVPAEFLAGHTDADLRLLQVRQLVRQHGGWAQARRHASGRGNEFLVRLPVSADAISDTRFGTYSGRRRVVVVEDDLEGRDTLRLLLRLAGHDVEVAGDGRQAVATILRHRPDVAFIDLGLPDLDGFEVARQVRAVLGDSVRLVAVTGSGRLKDHLRADDSGFEACLIKPITAAELDRTLAQGPARD